MSSHNETLASSRFLSRKSINKSQKTGIESDPAISSSSKLSELENNQSHQLPAAIVPCYSDEDPVSTPERWWARRRQTDLC